MTHILIVILSTLCAAAQDKAPQPQAGQVIRATGVGYPPRHMTGARAKLMARRAAEVVAVRNLAIKLSGDAAAIGRTQAKHSRVNARIRGFRYLPPRYRSDGSVEVTVKLPVTAAAAKRRPGGARAHPGHAAAATGRLIPSS
ncbi:MAG: hypothetical protein ACYSUI_07935, partial [Planctomycetota bacterium]